MLFAGSAIYFWALTAKLGLERCRDSQFEIQGLQFLAIPTPDPQKIARVG